MGRRCRCAANAERSCSIHTEGRSRNGLARCWWSRLHLGTGDRPAGTAALLEHLRVSSEFDTAPPNMPGEYLLGFVRVSKPNGVDDQMMIVVDASIFLEVEQACCCAPIVLRSVPQVEHR